MNGFSAKKLQSRLIPGPKRMEGLKQVLSQSQQFIWLTSHRGAWWSSLILLCIAGPVLLRGFASQSEIDTALFGLGLGAVLAVFTMLASSRRHLQIASLALAFSHGALLTLWQSVNS